MHLSRRDQLCEQRFEASPPGVSHAAGNFVTMMYRGDKRTVTAKTQTTRRKRTFGSRRPTAAVYASVVNVGAF